MGAQERLADTLNHYMGLVFEHAGIGWDRDNAAEMEETAELIATVAFTVARKEFGGRVAELERRLANLEAKLDRPQLADDIAIRDAHKAGTHHLCSAEWCAWAARPELVRESTAEAGIATEDVTPDAVDERLNGHAPTPFAEGGAL